MDHGADSNSNADIEHFQELADGAPVLIWMSGLDMGCFYFNRAWLDYRGRTTEQEFGNGWAEGVHPEDLERCVQHYVSSFERRASFAMSYRLLHHSGEHRWILDRGAPHFSLAGKFLGFYGGCAETVAEASVERLGGLRQALNEMHDFAASLMVREAEAQRRYECTDVERLDAKSRLLLAQHRAREHAAAQVGKLAVDMLEYESIENGACLR